jgi:serine/threonine protein kinase
MVEPEKKPEDIVKIVQLSPIEVPDQPAPQAPPKREAELVEITELPRRAPNIAEVKTAPQKSQPVAPPKPLETIVVNSPMKEEPLNTDTKIIDSGKMLGNYVIVGLLDKGGMGRIWKAVDPYAALEVRMLNDEKESTQVARLVEIAGVGSKDSDNQRILKVKAYVEQMRTGFMSLPEADRLDVIRGDLDRAISDERVPRVVIKTLSEELASNPNVVSRFKREITIGRELDHPNVVKVLEYGVHNGVHYAVMEYVEHIKLDNENLTPEQSAHITYQTLEGLLHAHDKNFLHRDIKPSNILVSRDFKTVKLTDFGIAKALDETVLKDSKDTGTGVIIGSPFFMSPELARNEEVAPESDVYSLGATLYKFLTGSPPHKGTSVMNTVMCAQENKDPQFIRELAPDVSEEFEDIAMMMLSKDLKKRLSAYEARDLLGSVVREKRTNYRVRSKEQEKIRNDDIKTLRGEIKSLDKKVARATRSGEITADVYIAAQKYEKLAGLLERDAGIYHAVDGDKTELKSARTDALEHAVLYYDEFSKKDVGQMTKDELMATKFTRPILEKRLALEKRRLIRFNELGLIKPQNKGRKIGLAASLVAAGILGAGLIGLYSFNEKHKRELISAKVETAESYLRSKDYKSVHKSLSEAENDTKDYPSSHPLSLKLRELRMNLLNSELYDQASEFYRSVTVSVVEKSDFATVRTSLEEALTIESRLPDKLKENLDKAQVETAKDLSHAVGRLIEGRKYSEASLGIETFNWFAQKIVPRAEEDVKFVGSLKEKIKTYEDEITKRIGAIKEFQRLSGRLNDLSADYSKLEVQLKADKFFKHADLNAIDEKLVLVSNELSKIDPDDVGPEDYDKKKSFMSNVKSNIQALGKELDVRQISYLAKISKELEAAVTGIDDYTNDAVVQKIKNTKATLETARGVYASIGQNVAELKPVEEQFSAIDTKLQDLDAKATAYPKLLKLAKDGSDREKNEALSNLVKVYVDVNRLDEAEKSLSVISDKTGLEAYVSIVSLEKKVADPALRVKRTSFGLDAGLLDSYSSAVDAYKADISKSDNMAGALLELYVKTNMNVKGADTGIKAVKALNDRIVELKDLVKNEPKPEYNKELAEKEKLFVEKRDGLYKTLDESVSSARTLLETQGKSLPPMDILKQLSEAYKAARYPRRVEAVFERFK